MRDGRELVWTDVQECEYLYYFDFFCSDYDKRPLLRIRELIRSNAQI